MATIARGAAAGAGGPSVEGPRRSPIVRLRRGLAHRALPAFTALAVVYLLLPIFVMIAFGFNDPRGRFNITWQGFTLGNYATAFARRELTDALVNSVVVAVISTLIATSIGTLLALALVRTRFRGRGPLDLLIFLPIATPEIVLGASLLALFVSLDVGRDLVTIVIAHVMFNISYVVITMRARISGLDRAYEEAAMDLGADELTTFRTVTLPLILPGILAGALLAFALSVDDFVITLFTSGHTVTLPLWVYGASRIGVPPEVNVIGTLIFASAVLGVIAWTWLGRSSEPTTAAR
ncbi:MAG: ABC transporter permease [Chloroflexi bacterium]|nr:ABC transporter permease [Chloroflexota bacterium]